MSSCRRKDVPYAKPNAGSNQDIRGGFEMKQISDEDADLILMFYKEVVAAGAGIPQRHEDLFNRLEEEWKKK